MSTPIELLYVGAQPVPDLSVAAHGPWVVHPADDLQQAADAVSRQAHDAIIIHCRDAAQLAALAQWSGLHRAVLDSAVLVLAPEPEAVDALALVRLGVQDVLPQREAGGLVLGRQVRLAVERQRMLAEARRAYATDLATGLPNHAQLMEHMTHLLALREREPAAMAVLALRVVGLSAAAARLGSESANVLRRKVAVRLRSALRASDVVASVGPENFAVLLAWIDAPDDAQRVATKLAAVLQRPFSVAGRDAAVAVAVGVAQYPQHGKDADALLRQAQLQAQLAEASAPSGRGGLGLRGLSDAANDD